VEFRENAPRCLWAKQRSRGGHDTLGSGLLRGEIMAGILDLIPEIGKLLDRFVPDPAKKLEAERMMKELDIRELEARMGVQKAWLSNNSLRVCFKTRRSNYYFNKIIIEDINAKLKKLRDSLSYRAAARRNCLSLLKKHSAACRSLY
jgi:hypothetical protein